jgi:RHS repeat-associated protein
MNVSLVKLLGSTALLGLAFFSTSGSAQVSQNSKTEVPLPAAFGEPGSVNVSTVFGAVSDSIQIIVPSGRRGVQPRLSLSYSSMGGSGIAGKGWGISTGRVEKWRADGLPARPLPAGQDSTGRFTFSLGQSGGELSDPDATGIFRARIEKDYFPLRRNGESWGTYDGGGIYYSFGSSANSRIAEELWLLDRVEDPQGNTVIYQYDRECGLQLSAPCTELNNQKLYLSEIQYTGHAPSNDPGANRIIFEYESRPDKRVSFQRGVREASNLRLRRLSIIAQGQLVRRYEMQYTQYSEGPSLLRKVVLVGADDTSRVTLRTLEYSEKAPGWTQAINPTLPQNLNLVNGQGRGTGVQMMDINGDGFADLVSNEGEAHLGDGQGHFALSNQWTQSFPIGLRFSLDGGSTGVRLLDVNGDGFPDIFVARKKTIGDLLLEGETDFFSERDVRSEIYLNNGLGWDQEPDPEWSASLEGLSALQVSYVAGGYDANCLAPHCEGDNPPAGCSPAHCIPAIPATEDGEEDIPANPPGCEVDQEQYIEVHCSATSAHSGFFDPSVEGCKPDHCISVGLDDAFFTLFNPFEPPATNQVEQFALVGEAGQATGVDLADVNGDGLVDIVWSVAFLGKFFILEQPRFIRAVFLNGGTDNPGWHNSNTLANQLTAIKTPAGEPDFFVVENEYRGYSFQDVNGDGLTDIVRSVQDKQAVYLKVGNQWIEDSELGLNYAQSMRDNGIYALANDLSGQGFVPMDFNEDGLIDYVKAKGDSLAAFVNTGSGWAPHPGMVQVLGESGLAFLDSEGRPTGTTMADINGDGNADLVTASGQPDSQNRIVLGDGLKSGQLVRATNTLGEVTEIEWTASTRFDNTTSTGKQGLPFPMTVAARLSRSDGRGNTLVAEFDYAGGLFTNRTLRGFAWAERKPSTGMRTETEYYQDDFRTGRPLQITGFDSAGTLRTRTTFIVDPVVVDDHITQIQLRSIDTEGFDTGGAKHSRVFYDYNDRLQIISTSNDPIVGPSGDENASVTTFVRNAAADAVGIWNLPVRRQTLGPAGELLAEEIKLYDEMPEGQAVQGLLSSTKDLLEPDVYVERSFSYDTFGNPTVVRNREGHESSFAYDTETKTFRVESEDPLGRVKRSTYDPRFGTLVRDEDSSGNATVTKYDAFGRIDWVVQPGDEGSPNGSTSFVYSAMGNPLQQYIHMMVTENSGSGEVFESTSMFDAWGNIYETHEEGSDDQTIVNLFEFDELGLPNTFSSPFFVGDSPITASSERDDLGRPVKIVDQLGQSASFRYRGRNVDIKDPRGEWTFFSYTPGGNVEQIRQMVDGEEQVARYDYDVLGRLTKVTDALGNQTLVSYDMLGRRTRVEDPNAGTFEYRYDNQGQLIEQIGADGESTRLRYSAAGELLEKELPDGSVQRFRYGGPGAPNAVGRLVEVEDAAGSLRFAYDPRGNVIEQRRTIADRTYVTGFRYDSLNRLLRIIYPDGFIVDYNYDSGGNIASITDGNGRLLADELSYNAQNRITGFRFGNGVSSGYTYDDLGRMISSQTMTSKGQGLQELVFEFDAANNVVALDDVVTGSSQKFSYDEANRLYQATGPYGEESYEYDAIGNLLRKGDLLYATDPLHPQRVSCVVEIGSKRGKAKGNAEPCVESMPGIDSEQLLRAFAVSYDARGNVATKGKRSFEYDGENRLARVYEANGRLIETNRYDANGEIVIKENQEETRIYIGNLYEEGKTHVSRHVYAGPLLVATLVESRSGVKLIETTLPPSKDFVYTAGLSGSGILFLLIWLDRMFGWRVRRGIAAFVRVVGTRPGSAAIALLLVCSTWPTPTLAANQKAVGETKTYYYHANHLGSVNVVTDDKERVTARRDYRPYGESHDWSGAQAGPRELLNTFQGQKFDDQTGLYYFKARHYDAELGRFMSADTVVTDINDPRTLHRYAFEGGNPVNYIDPTGRDFLGIGSWVDGAVNDAGNWIDGAITDAGNWFEGAGESIGQFFEEYGTEIIVIAGAVVLIVLGVFTGGGTTLLGLALLGGGIGFGIGGGIAIGLGYDYNDPEFWAASIGGAFIGAAAGVYLGGGALATGIGGGTVSAKTGATILSISGTALKGAAVGAVAGGVEGAISGFASGSSVEETLRLTLEGAGVGALIGFAAGGLSGGLGLAASGVSKGAKVARGGIWFVKGVAKAKQVSGLIYAGLASSGSGRPTKLTTFVYDSDFQPAGKSAKQLGNQTAAGLAPIVSGLGAALSEQSSASLTTSPGFY